MSEVKKWPVVPGSYIVGDPNSPVAVCTLTSERLMGPLATHPGVAISGMVYTANLGITRIIVNITSNPAIRFLLICGRDSQLFRPGQSLAALKQIRASMIKRELSVQQATTLRYQHSIKDRLKGSVGRSK